MKRFLSMLAMAVLVLQSMATSLVYATDFADQNESDSTPVVETTVVDEESDESSSDDVIADFVDSTDDVEDESLEEVIDETDIDEVVNEENGEENVEEMDNDEVIENEVVSASHSETVSDYQEQSWTKISNGLIVTAVDSLGAFPEGTEMVVTAIEEDDVFDLVNDAIDAEVTKVRAVDITFWYEGEEIEPSQPINVTMRTLSMTEPQTVVHIDDEENVEEMEADINGKTAEFEAESFSIYAIVETAVLTVNFHNGDETVTTIYVKSADEVESLVYDPGVEGVDGKVFNGWTMNNEYSVDTAGLQIDKVREEIAKYFPLGGDEVINFYPILLNMYTITYFDQRGVGIHVDKVYAIGNEGVDDYEIIQDYTPIYPYQNFEGWQIDRKGTGYKFGDKVDVTITEDVNLYADAEDGHWLVFDENGRGATYNAPQFVKYGESTTDEELLEMQRVGYTFEGWYTDAACTDGNEFTFGDNLDDLGSETDSLTIYAKWKAKQTAPYTVLIRKQNVNGDDYDFVEAVNESGVVRSTPNVVSSNGRVSGATYNGENGFSFKSTDQSSKKVAPEGNTVVNVYYDRNEYTLTFQDHPYTATTNGNGTQYALIDGQYVKLIRYGNNNYWYNGQRYNGTRYTQGSNWTTVKEVKALYGQNISNNFPIVGTNGATYDHGERWDPESNTPYSEVLVYIDVMPAANVTFHLDVADRTTKHIHYYVEALSGQTPTKTYNGMGFVEYKSINANYHHFTEAEDYIELVGFTKGGSTYSPEAYNADGVKLNNVWNNEKASDVYCYYTRDKYSINYMDGEYYNGNDGVIPDEEEPDRGQLGIINDIEFGADLSTYNKDLANYYIPTYKGFVLEGWYIDKGCTQPYTFDTMPDGGITVYAKWRQKQYRVFFHPEAGTQESDPSLTWGSEDQEMNFRVSYGGKVSLPVGQRDGYEFIGWFTGKDYKTQFSNKRALDDFVTSIYDKNDPINYTDEMDAWGTGATWNSDIIGYNSGDRFWITRKLDLYAKWRSVLEGAEGIQIIYDANGGSNAPTDESYYNDNSKVVAGIASVAPEGKQFDHWVYQTWNKTTQKYEDTSIGVYPGGTFDIFLKDAKEDSINDGTQTEDVYKTYTVQLRAEYEDLGEPETTTVKYCPGYEGDEKCTEIELVVNKEHIILDNMFNRGEGYVFNGWKDSEGNEWNVGSGVGADNENPIPNVLNAQWACNTNISHEVKDADGNVVACEPNEVKEGVECKQEGAPENAEYTVVEGAGVWDADTESYTGAVACEWACNDTSHEENGKCVKNEQVVETPEVCGELAEDSHAYYPNQTQILTYENGKWSEPDCTPVCETNYRPVESQNDENDVDLTIGNDVRPINPIVNSIDGVFDNEAGNNNVGTEATNGENEVTNGNSETVKVNNFRCEIMTNTVTFDLNGGTVAQGVETQVTVVSGETVKEIATSRNGYTFQGWTLEGKAFDFSTPITQDITLVAQWKSNGGGGGSSGGGKIQDDCPNGDNSGDLYDGKCDAPEEPGDNPGGGDDEEEIELGGQVSDKCSVEGSNRSEEEIAAYLYACENDITTIRDIEKARLGDFLTRAEMAKMISVFATKELGMTPNTSKDCSNFANSIASYNQEMKDYMVMSCQLEIMGIHTTNYEPIPDFMPSKRVSRAEFGTVLSRILWGNKYEGTNSNYYINHLNALKENNIITNINPNITEYRAWVFLMLYRSVEAIKTMKTNADETVEEQVNEELQEEGKAETGLVVEYDSGSVVPDMATVTESGTLATGTVAEIETGSVVEAETGDTASLTGDEISKEVSAETGATAETETGSTTD